MNLLALVIAFPLASTLALSFFPRMPERLAATVGAGAVFASACTTAWIAYVYVSAPADHAYTQTLWQWIAIGDFAPRFALYLDGLSLTMLGVITGVGFLIHWFATWYMREDLQGGPGMGRFFAYMNLFIVSMLLLVLGDNLLLLYLGWEGVGLCSYLLIGFYYKDEANAWAAYKAFVITRLGDVFLAIGLFLLFATFHTLNIQALLHQAPATWAKGDPMAIAAALLILGGAVGKSAQLPLQTWLPDAMAGPTPVSALIHAATMVTAGVYLIARTHGLFELAPAVMELVGVIGALTLLLAGFAALCQTDIKRVLAYSTMSQIGYMFLALGVGAWHAAIFHLMIHAFFKALLFLSAGSVIIACHHEQNIFRMGGLWRALKLDYAVFLVGGGALAALPLVTAGFFSKDKILWLSFANGHQLLWLAGLAGAFLTALYTFRMIFIAFHGERHSVAHAGRGLAHHLPLVILAVLSTFLGAWIHPPLRAALPSGEAGGHGGLELILEVVSAVVAVGGLGVAAALFLGGRQVAERLATAPGGAQLWRFWHYAWGFDWLYDRAFVRPYLLAARLHRRDWVNGLVNFVPMSAAMLNGSLASTENGRLRWYALSMFAGAAALLIALMFA